MRQSNRIYSLIKSIFDKIVAFFGIVILSPLFLFLIILIKVDSKGPAIFKQTRVGKNEKPFDMYKFRTMISTDIPFDINNPVIKNDNKYLTRVGRYVRRFKCDELIQLFNVLKGDMSIVGPRPFLPVYFDIYEDWEKQKFLVKPGMSGYAQIKGNGFLDPQERSFYDIYYAKHYSLKLDIEIVFKTLVVVIFGEEKYLKHVSKEDFEKCKKKQI